VPALACVLASACAAPRADPHAVASQRFEFSRLLMGVEARILLHAPAQPDAQAAAEAAFAVIESLDEMLSDWTAVSAASHLSAHAGEGPVAVSPELFEVVEKSLDLSRRTQGAFDPTVGPLVALWRRARTLGRMPDPAEILRARERVGADLVCVEGAGSLKRSLNVRTATRIIDSPSSGTLGSGLAPVVTSAIVGGCTGSKR
jgi:thiamine biosynthesis lipoprotein